MNETKPPVPPPLHSTPKMVPKICGGDYEVANYIENDPTGSGDAERAAMQKTNTKLEAVGSAESIRVRLNKTDGQGCSWGTHQNVMVHRDAFHRMTSGGANLNENLTTSES